MSKESYIEYLTSRNRKQTTTDGYLAGINACERCLRRAGQPTDPWSITEESFRILHRELRMKETSKRVRMRAYASYIEWETGDPNLLRRSAVMWNPPRYNPHWISLDDYKKIFIFFSFSFSYRVLLVLGAGMGLRKSEMARLTVSDYHGETMTVHGKGHGEDGDVTEIRVPREVRKEIESYLRWRKEALAENGIVSDAFIIFQERYGHASVPEEATRSAAISYHFAKMSKLSGIKVTPHSLRRLYATTLYRSGADVLTISKLMRHANPTVTWRYIQQTEDRTSEAAEIVCNILYISDTITI